jgi:hypothetical protein
MAELDSVLIIAAIFSGLACLVSAKNIYNHLKRYSQPHLQRYIVRILLIVPVYSVGSFISLAFPEDVGSLSAIFAHFQQALYFDSVRDVWEAYVIHCFLILGLIFVCVCVFYYLYSPGCSWWRK